MDKDTLRDQALAHRRRMDPAEVAGRSGAIHEWLLSHPGVDGAGIIMSYVSCRGEVDTLDLIRRWLAEGRRVCVPRTDPPTRNMRAVEIHDLARDLAPGPHGILEPAEDGRVLVPADIELHLVPGVLFDRHGLRLGQGAGYYDRFLAEATRGLMVGLAYNWQIVDRLPADPWDIRVDLTVAETGVIHGKDPRA